MKRDTLYDKALDPVPSFAFNQDVALVFDDMIRRSVPLYDEMIQRQSQIIAACYQQGTRIYDLGCSTGNLGVNLCQTMGAAPFEMIAVDNAPPMLALCARKCRQAAGGDRITPVCDDIARVDLDRPGVVVLNFTLQFLPLAARDRLIGRIFAALVPGGILLLAEKTVHTDAVLNRLQQDFHHRLKQENGYSALAVAQKREALDNVLLPDTTEAHARRLTAAGFRHFDVWLKWFNFSAWIARK
jgi:tRNA (cmo5U34)-methyltransferase